jgi:hypothetical protein
VNAPNPHRTAGDLALALLEVMNTGRWEDLDDVTDADIIVEWPQSGERIVGRRNLRHMFEHYPGEVRPETAAAHFVDGDEGSYLLTPMFTMVRTEGAGDRSISTVKTRYPDGSDWHVITIARAHEGKLSKVVQYFAPVYEAPEWRAPWVERMDEAG